MIPDELAALVEQQAGNVFRKDVAGAEKAITELGIPSSSTFAEFFRAYEVTLFESVVSDEQLCDVAEPTREIAVGTQFVHDVWGLPDDFICFTNVQGEGGYLYNRKTEQIFDFSLSSRDSFLQGNEKPKWANFFDFMLWYLQRAC